jgi:glycosyltransferase involved in cell wall biosynthesis
MVDRSLRRPRLVVISAVHPFPGASGQQQRVRNKLLALRDHFHTTFLTVSAAGDEDEISRNLLPLCDEAIVLSSLYRRSQVDRAYHIAKSAAFAAATGLKRSNYVVGQVELTPHRVAEAVGDRRFDVAVFEYWHAAASASVMRASGARCVLDMHDILWRSYDRQLRARKWVPSRLRKAAVARYRSREERSWQSFDAIIAISQGERDEVVQKVSDKRVLLAPMGIDLDVWPYSWAPAVPRRVAYYGGLGNPARQQDAMWAYHRVMPAVWAAAPDTEFWLIGSDPPLEFYSMEKKDPRVRVTGYLPRVQEGLSAVSVLLCPWNGRFGFRSRLIEAMALGVPVVASRDAAWGMGLRTGEGIYLEDTDEGLARSTVRLLMNDLLAQNQSQLAREQTENSFGFDATYGRLTEELVRLAAGSGGGSV